jgi:hypothetical protein
MWKAICDMYVLLQAILPLASNIEDKAMGHQNHERYHRRSVNLDDYLVIPVASDMANDDNVDAADEDDEDEPEYDLTDPAVAEHLTEVLIAAWNAPETLVAILQVQMGQGDSSDEEEGSGPGSIDPNEDEGSKGSHQPEQDEDDAGEGDDEDEAADNSGQSDLQDDADEDVAEGQEEGADEDTQDPQGDAGGSTGTHGDEDATDDDDDVTAGADEDEDEDEFDQDDLDDLLQEAADERDAQRELDADVQAFADAQDERSSDLDSYIPGLSNDLVAVNRAVTMASEIEQAFHESTMDRQPAWVEGQRRGIVNALRYTTRRPGDSDFFRAWTDDEQPGFDIAVSLLLDYSGSMNMEMGRLAEAAYAFKLACQNLGLPCTVTLWDTNAKVLWDATETADGLPVLASAGGTDPTVALMDLDNQRYERAKHIVMIMTDGDWDSDWPGQAYGSQTKPTRTLAAYKDAGRRIVGFGYGGESLAKGLVAKGCDEAFGITDLMEMPRQLERILLELV